MIGFLTIGSAATTYQPISNMNTYATNTKVDTLYYNLLSLSGLLSNVNNNSLLNFQTISSYYLLKSDAQNIYQRIDNMSGYLTIGQASTTYQTINNMSNYGTNSLFNTLVNTLTSLSGILYNELLSFQTISSYYL